MHISYSTTNQGPPMGYHELMAPFLIMPILIHVTFHIWYLSKIGLSLSPKVWQAEFYHRVLWYDCKMRWFNRICIVDYDNIIVVVLIIFSLFNNHSCRFTISKERCLVFSLYVNSISFTPRGGLFIKYLNNVCGWVWKLNPLYTRSMHRKQMYAY